VTGGSRALRGAGFFLVLLALCVALGLLIALPLWFFATGEPRVYTIVALALLAGGVLFLAVRGVIRRRRLSRNTPRPRASLLAAALSALATLIGIAGAYLAAALLARRLWVLGAIEVVIAALLLWGLGSLRAAVRKARKHPPVPAENRSR
jgi:hypothetical protein